MSEIKAALTKEEWVDPDFFEKRHSSVFPWIAKDGHIMLCSADPYYRTDLDDKERHALGALCLHEQSFGFTREYVDTLRKVIREASVYEVGDDEKDDMRSIADRIEALLPPEAG